MCVSSLKDVGLIIKANGEAVPIIHTADGHYGPLHAIVPGRPTAPYGPRSRGLDPLMATK